MAGPELMRIAQGVYQVARDPREGGGFVPAANTYLLGSPAAGDLALVDPGFAGGGGEILQALARAGVAPSRLRRVILTHTHLDHLGCLPDLLEAVPGCEVWAHREEAEPLERGDERTVYGNRPTEALLRRQFGLPPGRYRLRVQRKLAANDTIETAAGPWSVLHTPGHSAGSICLYCSFREVLISGDTLFSDGAIGRFDMHGADSQQLQASLACLAQLAVRRLLPGHGALGSGWPTGSPLRCGPGAG